MRQGGIAHGIVTKTVHKIQAVVGWMGLQVVGGQGV